MSISRKIIEYAIKKDSSDIHLEEGSPIAIRVNSDIEIVDKIISNQDMDSLLFELLGEEKLNEFNKNSERLIIIAKKVE